MRFFSSAVVWLRWFLRSRAGVQRSEPAEPDKPTPVTRPGKSWLEAEVPSGEARVPSRHPTPRLRRRPPAKRPQTPDPRGRK